MPDNHTAPGCMLRFDVSGVDDDAAVTLGFTYVDVTSADPVAVRAGAAVFTNVWRASKVGIFYGFILEFSSECAPCSTRRFYFLIELLLWPQLRARLTPCHASLSTRSWPRLAISFTCPVSTFLPMRDRICREFSRRAL